MKNTVLVFSKCEFHDVYEKYNNDPRTAIISIEGTSDCIKYYLEEDKKDLDNEHLLKSSDTVLNLDFDDITKDELSYKGHIFRTISKEQARETLEFIISNLGKDFIIHCKAGRSRSQAVGQFIIECFPEEYEESKERPLTRTPNIEVLGKLKRAYYERFGFGVIKPKALISDDLEKYITLNNKIYTLFGLIRDRSGYKVVLINSDNYFEFIPIEKYNPTSTGSINVGLNIPEQRKELDSILEIWDIKDDSNKNLEVEIIKLKEE